MTPSFRQECEAAEARLTKAFHDTSLPILFRFDYVMHARDFVRALAASLKQEEDWEKINREWAE